MLDSQFLLRRSLFLRVNEVGFGFDREEFFIKHPVMILTENEPVAFVI
jgi:hypothetical protein